MTPTEFEETVREIARALDGIVDDVVDHIATFGETGDPYGLHVATKRLAEATKRIRGLEAACDTCERARILREPDRETA